MRRFNNYARDKGSLKIKLKVDNLKEGNLDGNTLRSTH